VAFTKKQILRIRNLLIFLRIQYVFVGKELSTTNLFELKEEIYKPKLQYTSAKLNDILESILNQQTMDMDSTYAGGVSQLNSIS